MKYLKKLKKAMNKEQKFRMKYIKAKENTYATLTQLKQEYDTDNEERNEAYMLLEEFGLTEDFTEEEQEQCKEEQLSLPKRTFDEIDAAE
jgi:hypothetical protein